MPFGFAAAAVGGALLGSSMGGGGGGGGSTGAQQTGSTVYNTNIPQYAQPYVTNMLNATQSQLFQTDANGNITGFNPYQPYTGMDQQALQNAQQSVAGFSPLQQQAQSAAANLQTPGQYNAATGQTMRGIMGANQIGRQMQGLAASANPQDFQNQVGGYMNPYIQQSLAPQLQLANQQYGMAGQQMAGQATGSGAFGGSRSALQQGLNQQNQMLAQNQLISQGYNTAFNAAQNQYNQSGAFQLQGLQGALGAQQQGMAGAGQLGQLGAAQLAAQQGILGTQNQLGAQQQANAQQVINQGIQNYATAQQYPLMQLGTMSNMLRGLPMQSATTQQYQAAPSALTQTIGAAGTGAMLGSLYGKKEGGLLKTKKMVAGGIASYSSGDIVESTEADLEQMPSNALNKELASTTSDLVKSKIRGILQARAGAQYAGGGIIAFADSTTENNQSLVSSNPSNTDKFFANLEAQKEAARAPYREMVADEQSRLLSRAPAPAANPELVNQAYIEAAKLQAANQPKPTPAANPAANPAAITSVPPAQPSAQPTPAVPPTATGALGLSPGESVVQPGAAPGAITNAAPANAAPPNPKIVHAEQAKADAKNTPHISTEQYARDRALANPDNAAKVFGFSMPSEDFVEKEIAAKQAYVGPNDVASQVAKQEDVRAREEKTAGDREKLIWAQAFATMGTTPGSLLVAGMTGVKSAIPQLIASKDKRNEAMNRIDDAIAAIHKADRAERAGDRDAANELKKDGIKNYLKAFEIKKDYDVAVTRGEYGVKEARIRATAVGGGDDKTMLGLYGREKDLMEEKRKIIAGDTLNSQYYGMDPVAYPKSAANIIAARKTIDNNPDIKRINDELSQISQIKSSLSKVKGIAAAAPTTTRTSITQAEYDKLPKGATFTAPDGTVRTKG